MTDEEVAAILESEAEFLYSQDEPYSRQAFKIAIEAVEERGRVLHWMSKFCRHIDMGDKQYTDVEAFEFFKNKMKQQFGWEVEE